MKIKSLVIHPFLFAVFPILFLFSNNVNSVSPNEIIFPLLLVSLITALIWISLSFVLKSRIKSGLITSLGLIVFFSYGHIYILLDKLQNDVDFSHMLLLIPTIILFGLGLYYFIKTKRPLNNATKIVNVVAISIIIISFVSIGEYFITENYYGVLSEASEERSVGTTSAEGLPDIYYIILDGYAGTKSLQVSLNYDNSEFLDFLTKKGFYTSSESFSNYQLTVLSLPSTLNMKYINDFAEKKGNSTDQNELIRMSQDNLVVQNFKSKGYTIFAIEAGSTHTSPMKHADFRLCSTKTGAPSDFGMMLIRTTMMNPIHVQLFSEERRDRILCGFSELAKMAERDSKPKFVIAHLMIPHEPFIFGEFGEAINPKDLTLADQKTTWDPDLYLGQLKFANKKIREVIEKLTKTDTPPIIIIQSDHGMRGWDASNRYENLLSAFNNFKAYYFPGKGRNMEFETTTPVNSFRSLFNLYFDEKYELLEDRIYMNAKIELYQLTDVTHMLIKHKDYEKFLEIQGAPETSPPTTYQIIVSGEIFYGPQANPPDDMLSSDGTTIDGTINPTKIDNYFFTGDIVSITADQHIFSFVDGIEISNDSTP